jgi:hypothetical protein
MTNSEHQGKKLVVRNAMNPTPKCLSSRLSSSANSSYSSRKGHVVAPPLPTPSLQQRGDSSRRTDYRSVVVSIRGHSIVRLQQRHLEPGALTAVAFHQVVPPSTPPVNNKHNKYNKQTNPFFLSPYFCVLWSVVKWARPALWVQSSQSRI